MTSAAPQKRMVSSFFITLASPHRATVTQQQPALQAHSSPACDTQHTAVRVHPGDSRRRREDDSQMETQGGSNGQGWSPAGAPGPLVRPQSPKPTGLESSRRNLQGGDSRAAGICEEIFSTALRNQQPLPHSPACIQRSAFNYTIR